MALALALIVPVIAILVLTFYINVAIHEGGHWLAGKVMRFQTHSVQIGPLWWTKTSTGGKIKIAPWRGRVGGFVAMWPEDQRSLRSRFALFVLGGPLANLVSIAAIRPLFLPPRTLFQSPATILLEAFALFMFVYALVMGTLNLVPFHSHGMSTDGKKLLTILQGGPRYKRMMAVITIANLIRTGVRPRDYPPELVEMLGASPDGSTEHAQALLLRAYHYMDSLHDEEAVQAATEAAETVSPKASIFHTIVTNEGAAIIAWLGGDVVHARKLLDQSNPKLLLHPFARQRSEAILLLAEGKPQEALLPIERAEQLLESEMKANPEAFVMEQDWIRQIRQRIDRKMA